MRLSAEDLARSDTDAAQKIADGHPFFPLELQILKQDIPVPGRHTEAGGGLPDDRSRRFGYGSLLGRSDKDFQLLPVDRRVGAGVGGEPPDKRDDLDVIVFPMDQAVLRNFEIRGAV